MLPSQHAKEKADNQHMPKFFSDLLYSIFIHMLKFIIDTHMKCHILLWWKILGRKLLRFSQIFANHEFFTTENN